MLLRCLSGRNSVVYLPSGALSAFYFNPAQDAINLGISGQKTNKIVSINDSKLALIVFGERCEGDALMVMRFSSILITLRTDRDLNCFLLKHSFAGNIAPTPKILIFKL